MFGLTFGPIFGSTLGQKMRVDEYRRTEGQALRDGFKNRSGRAITIQRIENLPESRVPPLGQIHFFQEIPDTAVAVSTVEYPIGPQTLL